MSVPPPAAPAAVRLVGRDREIDRIEELVDSAGRGARFVVIRGEVPGETDMRPAHAAAAGHRRRATGWGTIVR